MAQNAVRFEALFSAPPEKCGEKAVEKAGDSSAPARDVPPPEKDMGPPPQPEKPATYQELDRKYRHRTYQAQELMVEKLLRGHFIDIKALDRKLNMFDLHFDLPKFMVILVSAAGSETMFSDYASDLRDGGQVGLIVSSIFSELLGELCSCYPANLENRYAFLLNLECPDEDEFSRQATSVCREAVRFIRENFGLELQVCVSGVCDGIQSLHDAFHETEVVAADSHTVYADGVCSRDESPEPPATHRQELTIEKQYLNALVTQDFQMALQLTLERARNIYEENNEPDIIRVRNFLSVRLQATSSVLSMPMQAMMNDTDSDSHGARQLDQLSTMEEIEQFLTQLYARLDDHYNTAPSDYTGTTGKVVHLIQKKYMEPDLSVEMICDCLGKSRSYLSRMFKENTGMNLLDYLHTTRLTEAKRLLNETDLGISEIASQVGYYSGWTLARVFKRYEGITPTAYRKAFCESQDG